MKRKITSTLLALGMMFSAHATIHTILVGQDGLTFSPSTLTVAVGDTVRFSWVAGSHTTTSVSVPTGATAWSSPISGNVTQFDYKVTQVGLYGYQCNPHAGAGMVGGFSATVTGVNDAFSVIQKSLTIAPNPAVEHAHIKFNAERSFTGYLKVYNSTGTMVHEERIKIENGENTVTLNTSKLPSGVYFLNLMDKNNSFLVEKLIKQ